jgi:hypothetical protein
MLKSGFSALNQSLWWRAFGFFTRKFSISNFVLDGFGLAALHYIFNNSPSKPSTENPMRKNQKNTKRHFALSGAITLLGAAGLV